MKLIIVAGVVALAGTLIGTRAFIGFLVRRGYGQFVRDDGPATHSAKRGTPTMGGLAIVLAVVLAYALMPLATLARCAAAEYQAAAVPGTLIAGALWIIAFTLVLVTFWPVWTQPRAPRAPVRAPPQ